MYADEHADEIGVHHRHHIFERLVGEQAAAADAGIVVEDVHLAIGLRRELRKRRSDSRAMR